MRVGIGYWVTILLDIGGQCPIVEFRHPYFKVFWVRLDGNLIVKQGTCMIVFGTSCAMRTLLVKVL